MHGLKKRIEVSETAPGRLTVRRIMEETVQLTPEMAEGMMRSLQQNRSALEENLKAIDAEIAALSSFLQKSKQSSTA